MPWQNEYSKMCSDYHRIIDRVAETRDVAEKNAIRKEAKAQHNKLQAFRVRHASMEGTQQAEIPETVIPALTAGAGKKYHAASAAEGVHKSNDGSIVRCLSTRT